MESSEFLEPISALGGTHGGRVVVLDQTGGVLAALPFAAQPNVSLREVQKEVSGYYYRTVSFQRMLVSYTRSSLNGWVYLADYLESVQVPK